MLVACLVLVALRAVACRRVPSGLWDAQQDLLVCGMHGASLLPMAGAAGGLLRLRTHAAHAHVPHHDALLHGTARYERSGAIPVAIASGIGEL